MKKTNSDYFQMRQYTITEQFNNILQQSKQVRFTKNDELQKQFKIL